MVTVMKVDWRVDQRIREEREIVKVIHTHQEYKHHAVTVPVLTRFRVLMSPCTTPLE